MVALFISQSRTLQNTSTLTPNTRYPVMATSDVNSNAPAAAQDAVLKPSEFVTEGAQKISGVDFNKYRDRNITVAELVGSMSNMGFQATNIGDASRVVDEMVACYAQFAYITNH